MIAAAAAMMIPATIPVFPSGSPLEIEWAPDQILMTPHRNPNMKSIARATPKLSRSCVICAKTGRKRAAGRRVEPIAFTILSYSHTYFPLSKQNVWEYVFPVKTLPLSAPKYERISLSLYASDLAALRKLIAALDAAGTAVSRTRLLCALPHIVSEAEIFAHAVLFHRRTREGAADKEESIDLRLSLTLLTADISKLRHVLNDLAAKNITAGRTFLIRALLHAKWETAALARGIARFDQQFPDPRTREGRAMKRG